MKQLIIIHVDTEAEPNEVIRIGKTPQVVPNNKDEMKEIILDDISWVSKALFKMIKIADKEGYRGKEEMIKSQIEGLNSLLENELEEPITNSDENIQ